MTTRTTGGAPPGMPAHLWEAAKQDVRGVIPDWLRSARENGADAPPHIREVARRAARAGAGLGVAIALGTSVPALAGTVGRSGNDVVAAPPAEASGSATAVVPAAHGVASPEPDPGPALAEAFRVPDPQAGHGGWLDVEMYQDVVVKESASAGYDVDAFQYLVVSDEAGERYVFKEHHHAALDSPPARETDLLIHERGQVHVVENSDGSFSVDTVGYDRSVRDADDAPVAVPDDLPLDPFDGIPAPTPALVPAVPEGVELPGDDLGPAPVPAFEGPDEAAGADLVPPALPPAPDPDPDPGPDDSALLA